MVNKVPLGEVFPSTVSPDYYHSNNCCTLLIIYIRGCFKRPTSDWRRKHTQSPHTRQILMTAGDQLTGIFAGRMQFIIMALLTIVGSWQPFRFLDLVQSRLDSLDGGSAGRKASNQTQNTLSGRIQLSHVSILTCYPGNSSVICGFWIFMFDLLDISSGGIYNYLSQSQSYCNHPALILNRLTSSILLPLLFTS
jgi:hypothetical protein